MKLQDSLECIPLHISKITKKRGLSKFIKEVMTRHKFIHGKSGFFKPEINLQLIQNKRRGKYDN